MTLLDVDKKDHHPMLRPKLDKEFSFNSEADAEEDLRVEIDPVHKAVGRESWYQVSCFHFVVVVVGWLVGKKGKRKRLLACAHGFGFLS